MGDWIASVSLFEKIDKAALTVNALSGGHPGKKRKIFQLSFLISHFSLRQQIVYHPAVDSFIATR
jgi:hypothetical protein